MPKSGGAKQTFAVIAGVIIICLVGAILAIQYKKRGWPFRPEPPKDLQELINNTPDGGIVRIPRYEYILKNGLKISGRNNLTIECEEGARILVDDIYEDVIQISNSENIRIENAYLRHVKPQWHESCQGSVVFITGSRGIKILNCELNGCGRTGLCAYDCKDITLNFCIIQRNSDVAISCEKCDGVKISNCTIQDNNDFNCMTKVTRLTWYANTVRRNGRDRSSQ
ncbi:MAG: right-handed parallel beta-helix repeat-containing protein [Planctomycetota bacterium]|nr:MAG: right-handed parallel beta-helix repeat-containing protein [Planctomycetota bacterium]